MQNKEREREGDSKNRIVDMVIQCKTIFTSESWRKKRKKKTGKTTHTHFSYT